MKRDEFGQLLYLAMSEPIGLVLRAVSGSHQQVVQTLYQARTKAADPALDDLQFRTSPYPDGDVVIVRRRIRPAASARSQLEEELL